MQINSLEQLIKTFSKLPGLGPKSAKRIALHLIQNKENMLKFSQLLENAFAEIQTCNICFNIKFLLDTINHHLRWKFFILKRLTRSRSAAVID